jgi:hypothetical protein
MPLRRSQFRETYISEGGLMARRAVYHYEARSVEGFIQQLAVSYIRNQYWFYVMGSIRPGKDPAVTDRKIIERYDVGISKWTRSRRKRAGSANVQYLRHERVFVLLATSGPHPFFREEKGAIRDARIVPIKYAGYAVSYRGGHVHVRIEQETYKDLKAYFLDLAAKRSVASLEAEFRAIPFEPYAPIRSQVLRILRAVNRARQVAGLPPVPRTAVRLRRRPCKPFVSVQGGGPSDSPRPDGPGRRMRNATAHER